LHVEGAVVRVLVNRYERDPAARAKAIQHHGVRCHVCGFDFAIAYGVIGEGFIHVHHTVPLADIGESYIVDPVNDLRPVCPNCHAMLHKRVPPYTIEELRSILEAANPGVKRLPAG
jgi:5-methylcytosine-specific restriction protein A